MLRISKIECFVLAGVALAMFAPPAARAQDDNPRRRWEYFYQQRAYPFNTIPSGALQRAKAQMASRWPALFSAAPGAAAAAGAWTPMGPQTIPISMNSVGRLTAIAIDPSNSSIIYVGGAQGGVWKTTDGGTTWAPKTDAECSLAMGSIAIDPVDPSIIYAGTGEEHFSGDSYYGCGVLKSVDGGTTWTQLTGMTGAGTTLKISRVVVDPATAGSATTTTVLAATRAGIYRSTNSGTSWTLQKSGIATDLVIDPATPANVYAGFYADGIYKSTDGGVIWNKLTGGLPTTSLGRFNIAIAPSAPLTLYAGVHNIATSGLVGMYKTIDGGTNWTTISPNGADCSFQCWYDMTIAVHPTDANTVYFGGVNLYRSIDGGTSFAVVTGGIHVDQHFLAFDPNTANALFIGNDGGIYRTADATAGTVVWASLNTNLALTQFYGGISLHPSDANQAMGGTQDNGTVGYTGTAAWDILLSGDGGFTAIDYNNPTTRYGETQWISSSGYSGPRRSDGGGYVLKTTGLALDDRALFIPPLVMDPIDPQTLYFGTFRLYKTTDKAETWAAISVDLTAGGSARISAIAPARSNSDVVYVGTTDGRIQVTIDGGVGWTLVNTGLPNRYVTDIAVHPTDWQTAYATVSGFGSGHIFKTINGGASWTDMDVGVTIGNLPHNAVLIEPGTPSTVYVGTDLGVFASTDAGTSWAAFGTGLPSVAIFDLAASANTGLLVAATHGRGMFSQSMTFALTMALSPSSARDTVLLGSVTPVPDSASVDLVGNGAGTQAWSAAHGAGAWLTLTTAAGVGPGNVVWSRDPTGLTQGVHVDTITVTAGALTAAVIDTFVVDQTLTMAISPASRVDTMVAGATVGVLDSTVITLLGLGAGTAPWTAAHGGGAWLAVTTAAGTGTGTVTWMRSASALAAGTFIDTVTVTAASAAGSPMLVIDTLVVAAAITLTDAANHLFNSGGVLTALQAAFLDSQGNDDGTYNLGDVLAWVDWCGSAAPAGCIASAAEMAKVEQLLNRTETLSDSTRALIPESGRDQ